MNNFRVYYSIKMKFFGSVWNVDNIICTKNQGTCIKGALDFRLRNFVFWFIVAEGGEAKM